MPTPTFTIRLSRDAQDGLARVATVLKTTSRAYAREILQVAATGDLEKWERFGREKALECGEQLAFDIVCDAEDQSLARKRRLKAKNPQGVSRLGGREDEPDKRI